MNNYLIISGIIFVLILIFGIKTIKDKEKEYGESLKEKNDSNINQKNPEEISKNKKQTLIALTTGLIVLLIGVVVVF